MKKLALLCALALAVPTLCFADDKAPAGKDAQAMEQMMKLAAPGPEHARLQKLQGQWDLAITMSMTPGQPTQTKATATCQTLMDGRFVEENTTGDMMGQPFFGKGISGYDNITKKYVSIWIDNMGTGIMRSEGVADKSGNVIRWTGESSDPMTGKVAKFRMVTTFKDDNHHTFEMYGKGPDGKEAKMMTIDYARRTGSAGHEGHGH